MNLMESSEAEEGEEAEPPTESEGEGEDIRAVAVKSLLDMEALGSDDDGDDSDDWEENSEDRAFIASEGEESHHSLESDSSVCKLRPPLKGGVVEATILKARSKRRVVASDSDEVDVRAPRPAARKKAVKRLVKRRVVESDSESESEATVDPIKHAREMKPVVNPYRTGINPVAAAKKMSVNPYRTGITPVISPVTWNTNTFAKETKPAPLPSEMLAKIERNRQAALARLAASKIEKNRQAALARLAASNRNNETAIR